MLLIAILGAVLYTLYLDQVVQVKFEGKRWAVPARVYARPLEVFAGADLDADRFENELKLLGYRSVRHPDATGEYSRYRGRFVVRTRRFEFWDGKESPQYLRLEFGNDRLDSLREARKGGAEVPLVRLEPPQIGSIYPAHREDRILVKREEMPEHLVQALISVEDREFYAHHGVSPKSIARAAWANVRAGEVVQGGSTLTQQLVKNFFLTQERSLWRKLNEVWMALILDWRYGKDEILEAYANEIYLGQDGDRAIHGFGLASQFYFNRPLGELDLPQSALLVALVRGPSYYEPRRHPERAKKRRDLVLEILSDQQLITPEQAHAAQRAPLGVTRHGVLSASRYPAFMDLVRRQLHRDYREQDLTSEGLQIFTTLDPWIQQQAEEGLRAKLETLERRTKAARDLEGAAVVTSVEGGEVLAVVGGREARFAGFNRALDAVRPIGSLVKPAVYLGALAQPQRFTLVSAIEDKEVRLRGPGSNLWSPQNYDKREHGPVPLYSALAHSYNLATVRLGMDLGVGEVVKLLRALGVQRPVDAFPSLLLGAVSLSPIEVAQVYQTLAAGGFYSPLRAIREVMNANREPLQRYPLRVDQVVSPGPVHLVDWAMRDVVEEGTGRGLSQFLPAELRIAGKTGTTDDLRDSWFAGFSGDKVAVVWIGRDDNRPAGLTGSTGALKAWGEIMARIRPQALVLPTPEGVEYLWVDPESGLLADEGCDGARRIPFIRGSEPRVQSSCVTGIGGLLRRFLE